MCRHPLIVTALAVLCVAPQAFTAPSPLDGAGVLLGYELLVDGQHVPDGIEVVSFETDQRVNTVAEATLVVVDGDMAEQSWTVSDGDTFVPGKQVELRLGYEGNNHTVFRGIVTAQAVSASGEAGTRLTVTCRSEAIRMTRPLPPTELRPGTAKAQLTTLAAASGLSLKMPDTPGDRPAAAIDADGEATWDTLTREARRLGMVIVTDGNRIELAPPATSNSAVLTLTLGDDLNGFNLELSAEDQVSAVVVTRSDKRGGVQIGVDGVAAGTGDGGVNEQGNLTGGALARVMGAAGEGGPTRRLTAPADMDDQAMRRWARAELLFNRLARIRGTVTFPGSALAKPNTMVELKGVGERFNGNAYVSGVKHTVADGQWLTTVTVGLPAEDG